MISVKEPMLMEEFPHKHDFDMYLTFVGFNPNGFNDLGAEIELYLGEEAREIRHYLSYFDLYSQRNDSLPTKIRQSR